MMAATSVAPTACGLREESEVDDIVITPKDQTEPNPTPRQVAPIDPARYRDDVVSPAVTYRSHCHRRSPTPRCALLGHSRQQ
jgi:hypothetical protein